MSNYQDWDDDDMELDETPKRESNNDLIKQLRKVEREKDKTIRELQEQLNGIKSQQRETVVKSILAERGMNPKVAKFIPADIDPTPESLTQWIDEYGDVFGVPQQTASENRDDVNLAALRQIDAVTANAQTPAGADDLLMRLQQAASADEIINMIHSAN